MLNYEFPPLGGGAANACYYLLKEIAKEKNLQIDLITSSISTFKKEKLSQNINIYYLDIGKNKSKLHFQTNKDLLIYSCKAYFLAKKLIKKNKYKLIHAWFGIPCGLIAMLLRKPYIVSLRGSDVPFYNPRFYWLDKLCFKYLSKIIWLKSRAVIANSQSLKKLALKTSPNQKILIIPNGVDTNFFKPISKIKKNNIILFVGRLIKRKGLIYLIKAFSALNKKYKKNYQLWFVGKGPEKEKLFFFAKKSNIISQVKFLGIKTKEELVSIYNQAKIFILPSLNEGMSNALLEAMACGLPIITTRTGDAEKLVSHKNGLIIKKKDVYDIEISLTKLCFQSDILTKMAKDARKKALKLSWKKSTKKYIQIYTKLKNSLSNEI